MGDETFSVDEALLATGFGKFQIMVLAYAGIGWASEAMEMMLLSFLGPAVQSLWNLTSQEETLISSVVFAGMIVGAYSWGMVSDRYGRRRGFLVTAVVTFGAGFFSAFAPNYTWLVVLRSLVGLGVGGGPVLSSWFLEFIPTPNRGTWMVVYAAFWTFGSVFEALLAWFVMPTLGWRWLLALSSLPSSLLLLFYKLTPESPRYLCLQGRKTEAFTVLETIARKNGTKLPSGYLVSEHDINVYEDSMSSEVTDLLSPVGNRNTNCNTRGISSLLMLFSPELLKPTLLLWVVFFGNAFSYYGIVLLTTELNSGRNKCNSMDLQVGKAQDVNYKNIFITSLAEFPGLLISAAMVDNLGRKHSMSSMFFLCFLFQLPLLVPQPETIRTILLFGARTCITATYAVAYIYAPEIYPTSVRSTGVGVASSIGRIGGMVCPVAAVGLIHSCHQTASILLFEIVILLSGFSVLLFPFETKGRELANTVSPPKHVVA